MLIGKYWAKDGLKEVPLEVDRSTGLWYRPNTSDRQMLKDATKKDYGTVNTKDHIVFDLGSNVGGFILKCAEEGAERVIAYEPEPYNLEVLQHNVKAIKARHPNFSVTVIPHAVGKTPGSFDLVLNPGSNSACSGSITSKPRSNRISVPIQVVSFREELDAWMPTLVKMDIEGAEYQLLDEPLPAFVTELACELHGFSKENSALMETTFARLQTEWTTVEAKRHLVFKSECLITAHFTRALSFTR
jgi:FkbM family methyltransferase